MEAFIAGAWRQARRGEILIGGQWRRVLRAEAYLSGQWRSVATFVPPLTVSANDVSGSITRITADLVVSSVSVATPAGGSPPYTYSWSMLNGFAVPSSPASASTSFTEFVDPYQWSFSTARVTCTDSGGSVATADIGITLQNYGY